VSLTALLVSAAIVAPPPVGPPAVDAAVDLDSAFARLVEDDDEEGRWTIPAVDDPEEQEQDGAQLRLRLLKLKLKVPI